MIQKTPLIVASSLAFLAIGSVAFAVVRQLSNQPIEAVAVIDIAQPFDSCYPSTFRRPTDVKQSSLGAVTWWEVKAQSVEDNSVNLLHFRTEDRKCKWLNRNRATFRLDYMPKSRAVDFALQHYQPMLDACKKWKVLRGKLPPQTLPANATQKEVENFCIQDMERGLKDSRFFPEELQALKRLKVDVNAIENHQIIKNSKTIQPEN